MTLDVSDLAHKTMTAVVNYFTAAGVALPPRQYLAPGTSNLVAVDDEQLTVSINRIYPGLPGTQQSGPVQHMLSVRSVEIAVQLFRQVSHLLDDNSGVLPTGPEMQADFEITAIDVNTMWMALEDARTRSLIVPQNTPYALNDVMTLGPDGGLAGVMGTITVAVT